MRVKLAKKGMGVVQLAFLSLVFIIFLSLSSFYSFAAVLRGNITLADVEFDSNRTAYNFTSNETGLVGHFTANLTDGPAHHAKLINRGSIKFRNMGSKSFRDFNNTNSVILYNFTDEWGQGYSNGSADVSFFPPFSGDLIQFIISNGTEGWYHGLMWIENITLGKNITIQYKLNNQTNNNTFAALSACEAHIIPSDCVNDFQNNCEWEGTGASCRQKNHDFDAEAPPADCVMLPKSACQGINDTVCSWNQNAGQFGKCEIGANFDFAKGFNCSNIINKTLCNNQPFTGKTGLCTWNTTGAGTCDKNNSKSFDDLQQPPVFFCEASGYVTNQTNCEILADQYFMPCGWNNVTSKCSPIFFDFDKFNDFEDIGSETMCQNVGGTWQSETAYDPINEKITAESWCEFGVSVKTFDSMGGGGSGFGGGGGRLNDCGVDCFACEFNSTGGKWSTQAAFENACISSSTGCNVRLDSNSFSGYGWCNPTFAFGGFNCDNFCGDCNLMPNPVGACVNSTANCKWDNVTNFCTPQGQKGCNQECMQCFDNSSCQSSLAPGDCSWDTEGFFCRPSSGKYEICFDGVDNDNNDKTDCADFKCASDPFCGGGFGFGAGCFQYDTYAYESLDNAKTNCSSATGCYWQAESAFFGFCMPMSDQCFENATLQTSQSECEGFSDENTCAYIPETRCSENLTMVDACEVLLTNETCMRANDTGCFWRSDLGGGFGECDTEAFFSCEMNDQLRNDQSACIAAGCSWQGDSFDSGFEGGFFQSCVTPCFNASITTQAACEAANGSNFVKGTCAWQTGFCEPKNFIGGCQDNDGDITACSSNSNCNWFPDPFGILKNFNGSDNFESYHFTNSQTWLAVGLQHPVFNSTTGSGSNVSNYTLRRNDGSSLSLLSSTHKVPLTSASSSVPDNVTQLLCSNSIILEYNWSTRICEIGQCNTYNNSYMCGGNTVHYFFNNNTGELEALWEVDVGQFILNTGNGIVSDTPITATVQIDGSLLEQANESATALDGTNATRVRTQTGFCDDLLSHSFFQGIDSNPPEPLAGDVDTDADVDYLDITGLGVKKTPEAYMYGMTIEDLAHSALCYNTPLLGGGIGRGTNKSRYFIYLDTDGRTTGGCSPENNLNIAGFEYRFKYIAEIDGDGKFAETFLSQACSNSQWISTNIPFKSDNKKSCSLIGGPIFAIDKDTLTGKSDVNTSAGWRAYGTSAGENGNASAVNDTVGPGTGDFRGVDVSIVDCTSTTDKDNSQCTKFKQFGFFPGEFGPACSDSKDNDGDGSTDCSDPDCYFDPFFCGSQTGAIFGQFTARADDTSSPSIVWNKVNSKIPTSLAYIFDTDEPANGTILFFNRNSTCTATALNSTLNDSALVNDFAHDDYRPHHVAEIDGLKLNTTYFYKIKVCDPSDNCAVTSCSNATTAVSNSNVTFKLAIPDGWGVDIPAINLTNYSSSYALKASTEFLNNINITIRSADNTSAIKLVGVDIFEKQTLNISRFLSGNNYVGLDANQYQNFKQKTGIDTVIIKIPASGTPNDVDHCNEDGSSGCQDVGSNLDCTFAAGYAECEIPDAVGLGFSTYKATAPSSSSSSSSGGGGGGGSSGGGGVNSTLSRKSKTQFWATIPSGIIATMLVDETEIPITKITFIPVNNILNGELAVTVLKDIPALAILPQTLVYQYLLIEKKNIASQDVVDTAIEFKVNRSWISQNNIIEDSIVLLRYTTQWEKVQTSKASSDAEYAYYKSVTPGFSYFAITGETITQVPSQDEQQQEAQPITETSTEQVEQVPAEAQQAPEEKQTSFRNVLLASISALIVVLAVLIVYAKTKQSRKKSS